MAVSVATVVAEMMTAIAWCHCQLSKKGKLLLMICRNVTHERRKGKVKYQFVVVAVVESD